jgi:hypothetical protein
MKQHKVEEVQRYLEARGIIVSETAIVNAAMDIACRLGAGKYNFVCEFDGGKRKRKEWVTLLLRRRDVLVCATCAKATENQQVHMYVNGDFETEKVICDECWNEKQMKEKGEKEK